MVRSCQPASPRADCVTGNAFETSGVFANTAGESRTARNRSGLQDHFQSLPCRLDMCAVPGHLACVSQHARDAFVVVSWIMMKKEELLDAGALRQFDHVVHTGVAPADVGLVFGAV